MDGDPAMREVIQYYTHPSFFASLIATYESWTLAVQEPAYRQAPVASQNLVGEQGRTTRSGCCCWRTGA